MGADVSGATEDQAGDILADRVVHLMKATGIPNGLRGVGYSEEDLPKLVDKAFPQKRLLDNGPRPVSRENLEDLFRGAMSYRSEEHTSELQSLMRTSYAVFCLKKKKKNK